VTVGAKPVGVNDDKISLEEQFQRFRQADVETLVRPIVIGLLGSLLLGSLVLSLLEFIGSLHEPVAVTVVLVAVFLACLIPIVLQGIDQLRKSGSRTIDRIVERIAGFILRRKQISFITRYGRQEIAEQLRKAELLSPEMACRLSVKHRKQVRRRRRRWLVGTGLVVAAAVTGITLFVVLRPSGRLQVQPKLGNEFRIDHMFAITVLDAPRCSKATCSLRIRFRNISNYSTSIGYGSFTDPATATTSGLCNPSPLAQCFGPTYVISLIGHGNYYNSVNGTFNANYLLPEKVAMADFTFQVPDHTVIEELKLSNRFEDAIIKFLNS
jgi:hypothetical protein